MSPKGHPDAQALMRRNGIHHLAISSATTPLRMEAVSVTFAAAIAQGWGRRVKSRVMSILKVARMGHPVLRAKARGLDRAEIKSPAIQALIDNMMETMAEYHGVGLAAPQVHAGVRVFVASIDTAAEGPEAPPIAIINPEITVVGSETIEDWEGCLSIPDIRGLVPRAREIKVHGYDRKGERVERRFQDFAARVVQHETDHLDGVLFFDRMRSFGSLTFLDEYSRYWIKDRD